MSSLPPTKTSRIEARNKAVRRVRRITTAVALSAAAGIGGVAGAMAATWQAPASTTTTTSTSSSSDDEWGNAIAPGSPSGGSAHTSSGGS